MGGMGETMTQSQYPEKHRKSLYLLFWPVFGLRYLLIENCHPARQFHPVHCALDDRIPFLEAFIIPYVVWYLCIIGMHLWLFLRDDPAFRQYSRYLVVSMSISTLTFLLYPTCQNLRPETFPRDNVLTDAVGLLYRMDTCTNVCPSEHVIGSAGFFLAALYSREGRRPGRIALAAATAFLTAIATVFLKQHSMVDVIAAIPVCAVGWFAAFRKVPVGEKGTFRRINFGRSSA